VFRQGDRTTFGKNGFPKKKTNIASVHLSHNKEGKKKGRNTSTSLGIRSEKENRYVRHFDEKEGKLPERPCNEKPGQ